MSARDYDRIFEASRTTADLEGSKGFAWFLELKRVSINSRLQVFGYEPEALNVDVAGEVQYLLGGKGNDALEALHHTPAMRVTIYLAKPLSLREGRCNTRLKSLGS